MTSVATHRRVLIWCVALLLGGMVLTFVTLAKFREANDARQHRKRIALAQSTIRTGASSQRVRDLLGSPTYVEDMTDFRPVSRTCRDRSLKVLVYQLPPEPTLLVFVDSHSQVTCVETSTGVLLRHVD